MLPRTTIAKALLLFLLPFADAQEDAYEKYVNTSKDFTFVRQDKEWLLEAWPGWIYMPWTWKWRIGYDDESGAWSKAHGYNGAFLDHGQTDVNNADKLDWINRFELRFYVDHLAGKGDLHLWDGGKEGPHKVEIQSPGVRRRPVNDALREQLEDRIRDRINKVKSSPFRAAYALDDEISWGHFVMPCMWRVTDDNAAYVRWLKEIYGPDQAPEREGRTTYDAIWPQLALWRIEDFDCSRLMDQWTFNDSYWLKFIGGLVAFANENDPDTPCGFVGGQSPSPFGGYDYAKVMRKVQFIEAYDLGGSQAVIRSFNRHNALPTVTTHFHSFDPENPMDAAESIRQVWYYLAHGNRGFIGWVENWFDDETGKPLGWHEAVAPHYLEAGGRIGTLTAGAEWIHDGAAIYYSHASIQLGWILDAEAHGKTWRNRNNDHALGASHLVRRAWENMLRDEGLQYDFISYADVIQKGVPKEYEVLILPAALCLSDAEAKRIKAFCKNGGTVIADYMPGLWDQHGRGRKGGGALDDLFGVRHDPGMWAHDVFQKKLWTEVDQEKNFEYERFDEFLTRENTCIKHPSGYNKAVRKMEVESIRSYGRGKAVLMNLSPQRYNAYRARGFKAARKREVFMKHLEDAGLQRWVKIDGDGEAIHGYEITYWHKEGRTAVFVCRNPDPFDARLKDEVVSVRLEFIRPVMDVRDERTGRKLDDGSSFEFEWKVNEALVISFKGAPPQ